MKKTVALLFALVMLLSSVFTGCAGGSKAGESESKDATQSLITEEAEITPDIPDGLTFNGATFNVYDGGHMRSIKDFTVEEGVEDQVNAAKSVWLAAAQERFSINIECELVITAGGFTGGGEGYKKLAALYTAGDTSYDAVMIGGYDIASAAPAGYLDDFSDYPYIDIAKDWWDREAAKYLSVYGKLYYTTGEISLSDNHFTWCMIFNKDMIREKGLESPYDLIADNIWTVDKMSDQIKTIREDLNGDDKMTEADRYGLLTYDDVGYQLLASCGGATVVTGADGALELALFTEANINMLEKYRAILFEDCTFNFYRVSTSGDYSNAFFCDNKALYFQTQIVSAAGMRDTQTDYGIIPYPKLSENQEDYGHYVSAYHAKMLGIPTIVKNRDLTGAVLEYLAWSGKKLMTPAYYDKTLVGTYIRDDESAEMLDIIFSTHVFDVGLYLNVGEVRDVLKNQINTKSALSLSVVKAAREKKYNTEIEKLNEKFAALATGGD